MRSTALQHTPAAWGPFFDTLSRAVDFAWSEAFYTERRHIVVCWMTADGKYRVGKTGESLR